MTNIIKNLDAYQIQQYQQNRYPLLFVDKITEVLPGKYAKGYKNFTFNEWFFPAHFEDEPNVPGFIQVETLTQVFLMTFLTLPEYKSKKTGFISINNMHFKQKIIPGDRLDIYAELFTFKKGLAKGKVIGYILKEEKNVEACKMELEIAVPDILLQFKPKKKGI